MRSSARAALAALALLVLTAPAGAEDAWPSRAIKVIVPNPPAGGADNLALPMVEWLGQALGQPFVIDNRGGASGAIGLEALARAPKDGYTLMIAVNAPFVALPHVRKLSFDPLTDIQPVAMLTDVASGVAIHPSVLVQTFRELIEYSRAHPGAINYASAGVASITHLLNEMISREGKLGWIHVPYKGNGEALADLMSGNIQLKAKLETFRHDPVGNESPAAVAAKVRHHSELYAKVIADLGIKQE